MSDAHDHGASHDAAHANDAHGHDDFDPEPAETLSEGEPRTPSWMPLLGAGLFVCGAIWFLASDGAAATAATPSASAMENAAAATPPAPPPSARPPQNPADRQKLIEAMKKRKEQLDQAKAARTAAPGAPPPTVQRAPVPPRKAP